MDHNDKKRYELTEGSAGEWLIRANQGHSLKTIIPDSMLEKLTGPIDTPIIHGTSLQAWKQIKQKGLSKMNRNHIHFAIGLPNDPNVKSGIRETSEVFIYVNAEKARQGLHYIQRDGYLLANQKKKKNFFVDGIVFYRSKNNVILSDGIKGIVAPTYFEQVTDKGMNRLDL